MSSSLQHRQDSELYFAMHRNIIAVAVALMRAIASSTKPALTADLEHGTSRVGYV